MIKRLKKKGIRPDIIPGFVRDLLNAISINPECSLQDLNSKLHENPTLDTPCGSTGRKGLPLYNNLV
jgi:hypothetical protein